MSTSLWLFVVLIVLVGLERVAELVVSLRNARWSFERGGVESGKGHYPFMVLLHTGFLAGCLVEAIVADRPFVPWLGWPMLAVVLLAQGLRWWCITVLGHQWNTRVIVVPGLSLVAAGPYKWIFAIRTMLRWWPRGSRCRWCTRRGSLRCCSWC